jgi:hypothetical protein
MAQNAAQTDCDKSPVALFYLLEDARRRRDLEDAAAAKRKLAELGIVVRYRRQRRPNR